MANHIVLFSSVRVGHFDVFFGRSIYSDYCRLFSLRWFIGILSSRTCECDSFGNRIFENIIQKRLTFLSDEYIYLPDIWTHGDYHLTMKTGMIPLQSRKMKDCPQSKEIGKKEGVFLSYGLHRRHGHTNTLVLDFYSTERSDTCNFKMSNL